MTNQLYSFRQGDSLLSAPLDACLWRAPTDNDRGGGPLSYHSQWRAAGLHCLVRDSREADHALVSAIETSDGFVIVETAWTLHPREKCPVACKIACTATYVFMHEEGGIHVTSTVECPASLPPLPRVGIRMALSGDLYRVQWFGAGPHEAYDDRRSCAYLGLFDCPVEQMHTPYVFPQENGRRAEPRWFSLRRGAAADGAPAGGVIIVPFPPRVARRAKSVKRWGFSASRHSLEQLEAAAHEHELEPSAEGIHVHVDSRSMGTGGFDSWSPNVESRYHVRAAAGDSPFVTSVVMIPIANTSRCDSADIYNYVKASVLYASE